MPITNTTGQNPAWDVAKPNVQHQTEMAKQIYEQGAPAYYTGNTVAGLTPEQLKAHTLATNAGAQQQAGYADQAYGAYGAGVSGQPTSTNVLQQYATGDPSVYNQLVDQSTAAVNRAWGQTGTLGSARNVNAIAGAAGDVIAKNQLAAAQQLGNQAQGWAGLTPTLQAASLAPAETFANVGAQLQAQNQAQIDADIDKYNYNANLPSTWLQNYIANTPGAQINPGTTNQYQNQQPNTFEKITGIGSLLLGAGGLF